MAKDKQFNIPDLLEYLLWKDKRTLIKYLDELKEVDLIKYKADRAYLIIESVYIGKRQTFIQPSAIERIKQFRYIFVSKKKQDLKEAQVRLFCLYNLFYNKDLNKAFPSYQYINKELGIKFNYISAINENFDMFNIVNIKKGEWIDGKKRKNNEYRSAYFS